MVNLTCNDGRDTRISWLVLHVKAAIYRSREIIR